MVYTIGMIIALILGIILLYVETKEAEKTHTAEELQAGMVAVIAMFSWLSVIVLPYVYREQYKKFFRYILFRKTY